MRKTIKIAIFLCMITAAVVGMPGKAQAAEKISKVSLKVEADLKDQEDMNRDMISVRAGNSRYEVESVEIMNCGFYWETGDRPEIQVTLQAAEDCYFAVRSKDQISLYGCGAEYVNSSRDNTTGCMTVTMKLEPVKLHLEKAREVRWDGNGKGAWLPDEHADSYEVRLYRSGKPAGPVTETAQPEYDFSGSMSRSGSYSYMVRPVSHGETEVKGHWTSSPEWIVE